MIQFLTSKYKHWPTGRNAISTPPIQGDAGPPGDQVGANRNYRDAQHRNHRALKASPAIWANQASRDGARLDGELTNSPRI